MSYPAPEGHIQPLPQIHSLDDQGRLDLTPHHYDERAGEEVEAAVVPELHEVDIPTELRERIAHHLDDFPDRRSASIPALWEVQRHYGWCTPEGIRQAAAVLKLTPGFLQSVASFYDMFKLEPIGRHVIMVCTNISCWLNGADDLMRAFAEATGAPAGRGTSPDGLFELEHFECLGACDLAPMASIDYRYYGPLSTGDAQTAIDQLRASEPVLPDRSVLGRKTAGGELAEVDPRVAEAIPEVEAEAPRSAAAGPAEPGEAERSEGERVSEGEVTEAEQAPSRAPDSPTAGSDETRADPDEQPDDEDDGDGEQGS